MARVGFIGLGAMGLPMADRLISAGHRVQGYDVAAGARDALAVIGGTPVMSADATAEGASAIILMLPHSGIVESTVDELIDSVGAQTTVIDMSSSSPTSTRALAQRLRERGIPLVDAPVSGGVAGARAGRLTVMVGGDAGDVEVVRELLETFGRVEVVGPTGAGHAVKALNNMLSATHMLATAEVIEVAKSFGLDPTRVISAINTSSGKNWSSEYKWPKFVLPETYDSGFSLGLMRKDIHIAVDLSTEVGRKADLCAHVAQYWDDAGEALSADADHTDIARWVQGR